ncbi:SusC/RagA family TonB-linked outer membrane protein [Aquimarina muelleri]|uniref:SusC/RagA family TonB-linked outer membrane protein n=1 Tax=Aquimarina muelleri TaxID=279356 RepID=A0A918JUE4_9FLAO|nr:SusC/RagA family TonB-linked outer membrane protein [Aquimarina muelleri]MCX2762235.1 SusC/RagA family TonB-linked outer membrane protein [Aquimarina muelleri]GGX18186.1 SusC/RagA family TonB-linked outer membrane protein [Aquimarina muelleri]
MKQKILTLITLLFFSYLSFGQGTQITGNVKGASDNIPLPGVNIIVKGTTNGVQTDFDGNYAINASLGDVIVYSYLGMVSKEVTVGSNTIINVLLDADTEQLDDVIVTALGISKAKKTLTYAAQELGGEELNKIKQTNPINSLSGKVSGLTVSRSSSGLGGATKVVLRGSSSTTNNDPLYVIDGVPMLNNGNGQNGETSGTNVFGSQTGNRDGGDALSLINPDDIESMTILKGASAAALYGSQGANGVILISTKKGKEGQLTVNYNSSITIDNVISLPKLQTEYQSASVGQPIAINGRVADAKSWGSKTSGLSNTVDDFFETGHTSIQSLSLSAGNQKAQTYFSYANTVAGGVMPNNKMVRNNITLRETAKFLNDKISVSGSITLSDQRIWNRPTNGLYSNPLTGLYLNPVGIDLNTYKNKFEYFNANLNMMDQFASSFDENIQQNPYWLINRNLRKDIAQRVLANVSIKYQITDDFSLQSRGSFDKSFFTFDQRIYGGSDPTFASATGRYILEKTENTQQYIDLIATYNKQLSEDFTFTGILGTSLTKYATGDQILLDSGKNPGLKYPNVFTIANFSDTNNIQQKISNREVQSVFGSMNIGFKNMLFLDVTGRSDWSSTLAFTDTNAFFYPSVGLTGVISEMVEFPEFISFGKIRTSYAIVGKDIPAYASNQLEPIELGTGNASVPRFGVIEGETLKPEEQKSFEIGTEWRFLQNRLGFDFTYYSTTTSNQIFFIAAEPNITGLTQNIVNAGEILNKGIELTLNAKPIVTENFKWNTSINFATNENKVISVHPSLNNGEAILTASGVNGYAYSLIEGEDFGSIRASSLIRNENGTPIVTADDLTLQTTGKENTVAHAQPDYTLGWNNTFDYKDFSLNILIDAKVGGDVLSVTEAINDKYGVSQASADARNTNGGMIDVVDTNGNATQISAQAYYNAVGGRDGILGEYVYSATNINVREVSLGYNLNFKNSFIENVKLSLIANNLFFIYKDAPFDPNIASSTGIGLQGVDIYGQPSTRSIGLNINVKF